jgi:hypothetical protein
LKRRIRLPRRDLLITLTLLFALAVSAVLLRWQTEAQAPKPDALSAKLLEIKEGLYAPEPGAGVEGEEILSQDAYWNARYTYPTGRADRRWLIEAAQEDKTRVRTGVPDGRITYNPGEANSPLVLNPTAWLSIGPKPQDSATCQVCFPYGIVAGRVNDVVVNPMTPTIAYLAADSGGVWKTTNCCSSVPGVTTWAPVTDDPLISTVAIGDLTLDPTNGYVYAATGDLRFGSFSFGSAGVLKSTDNGATWSVKGADVFGPYYEQSPGLFPQYNSVGKVEVDPRNSNTVVASAKNGLFLSYDGGNNWAGPCLPDPYPTQRQDITAVQLITNTGNITELFVGVGARGYSTTVQVNLAENGANGIYKSTIPVSGCPANWSLVSRPNNGWPGGSGSGIPQYLPGGNQIGRIDMAVAPSNHNYIYAEVQAINPGNGAIQRGGLLGVWRSTDRGNTWEQRVTAQDLEDNQDACGGDCVTDPLGVCGDVAQNWYDQHIAVDPNDPDVIFFDNTDVWRSTDGGDTIKDITCGYSSIQVPRPVHVDQHAITFMPGSSSRLLFGNDGGVYYSETGDQEQPVFTQLNTSLSTIELYGGDISANFATSPNPFAVAGAQDNGSSSWQAVDPNVGPYLWQERIGGDGMFARIEPVLGQNVYMEAQNGALRRSESGHPGPYPLLSAATNFSSDAPRLSFVWPYEIYKGAPLTAGGGEDCPPTGCKNMIGGTYRVWENNGGALTSSPWVVSSQDLTKNTLADRSFINQLAYAPRTSKIAIAGTNDGNVAIGFSLHSLPVTATWRIINGNNTVLPNRPVLDVALDPTVGLTSTTVVGYAAVGGFDQNTPAQPGHVFKVSCAANCISYTWENKSGNLPNVPMNAITANPNFPQQVFAGSDWGVYFTNNINANPPTWTRFNNGMPNVMIWDFAIDRGFTTLAAFTRSRGTFVWPLPSAPFVLTPTPTRTGTPPTATNTTIPVTRTPAVPPTYTPGPTNTPPNTATPQSTATPLPCGINQLLFEGFESGTLGVFTATTALGSNLEAWMPTNSAFYSGAWSAHVVNNTGISDQRLEMRNAITIPVAPAAAQLQFYHRFKFEAIAVNGTYDGGVLEYSTDGGSTWVDAGSLITEGQYNAIIAGPDNPLQGRQGYGGQNTNYPAFQRVTVNLDTLRGMSVKFRYREGSDQNTGEDGWYVDNVIFTSGVPCATSTATAVPPTQTPGGPTATAQPSSTVTRTNTAVIPTGTNTAIIPTQTPGGPTATLIPTGTNTVPVPSATITQVANTATATATHTTAPTQTPGGPSATTEPSQTPVPPTSTTAPSATPSVTSTPCTISFTDVPPDHIFYAYIRCLACRGVVSGYDDGTFRPFNDITRGQIAKVVSNSAGFDEDPGPQVYEDVDGTNPFYVWINRLSNRGHMGGYPCGSVDVEPCFPPGNRPYFRPFNNATRGQLSKIVSNAAGLGGTPSGIFYTDVQEDNPFYLWIMRLTNIGAIGGYACGGPGEPCDDENRPYFRPFNNVTRGQASKIVANAFFPGCEVRTRR